MSLSIGKVISIEDGLIKHNASTNNGSSGSPIIRRSNKNIIGIHYGGLIDKSKINYLYNLGTSFDYIIDDIIMKIEECNLKFMKNLVDDAYCRINLDNTFLIFESINNILYLVYSNKNKSIIIFDLIKEYKIKETKNCHDEEITNFSHFLNKEDKQDLFISISANDNNLKLWNFNNFECILNLKNVNKNGFLDCACFFNDDNKNYIITYHHNKTGPSEPIKLFDFKGEKIQEIKKSNENTTILYIYKD